MKSCSATFCLDQQFVEITIDGRKMMTIFTLEEIFENGKHHLALSVYISMLLSLPLSANIDPLNLSLALNGDYLDSAQLLYLPTQIFV